MKNLKKILFIIAITLMLLGITAYIGKILLDRKIKDVMATMKIKMEVKQNGNTKALIMVDMKNKAIPSALDSVQYLLLLDHDTIGKGVKVNKDSELWEDSLFSLPLEINQKKYLARIKNSKGEKAKIRLNMKIYVLGNLLNKRFYEINKIQDFILPIQPKIEIEKVKFEKFGLKNSELMLHLRIINFNTYQVQINKLHYEFKIKDYLSAEGYKDGTVEIKPKQTTFTKIPMQIEMKHVGKMIGELIKNKKKLPFEVFITCKAKAAGLQDPIDINTKINGVMDLGK